MLTRHQATEVLIVGAGPVGLLSAIVAAEKGLQTQIIDDASRRASHSYALALHPRSLQLLDSLGLAAEVLRSGLRVETVLFYDGKTQCGELRLSELPVDFPYVVVLRQDAIEQLLEQRLRRQGLRIHWNHRLSALEQRDVVTAATIEQWGKTSLGYAVATDEWVIERTRQVEAKFIIGADGHRSGTRRALDISFDRVADPEFFAVFEFACGRGPGNQMRIILDENGTNVLWPLPGGFYRWSFQLRGVDISPRSRSKARLAVQMGSEAYPHLTREDLEKLIRERAPWFTARIGEINWSMAVRFERRLAREFGRECCWLAGDAAHLTSPAGIQSMNVGLREATDLINRIFQVLREGASLNLLQQYNRNCLAEWQHLLGQEGRLVAGSKSPAWIRRHAAKIIPSIPGSGEELAQLVDQLGVHCKPAKGA